MKERLQYKHSVVFCYDDVGYGRCALIFGHTQHHALSSVEDSVEGLWRLRSVHSDCGRQYYHSCTLEFVGRLDMHTSALPILGLYEIVFCHD